MTPATADDAKLPAIEPLGETVLLLRFGTRVDAALSARVHAALATLQAAGMPGVTDFVAGYASLALHYRPADWAATTTPWRALADAVQAVLRHDGGGPLHGEAAIVEIPVRYGGDDGRDLDELASLLGLSVDDVVARHVAGDYRVAMLGFAPGFPYLLGLDPRLHAARLAVPRTRVPRGSVAIGGAQTGIYPRELPGGWRLIGRTPLALFDPRRDPPNRLAAGDRVRFRAIDADEFAAIEANDA